MGTKTQNDCRACPRMTRIRDRLARMAAGLCLATALAAPAVAHAQGCDARPAQSQFVKDNLRRAGSEADLATAQDVADRARRGLDQLAIGAARCGCALAQSRFDAAAAEVRRARDAESRKELRDIVARALPVFDEAMAALRDCAAH